MTENNSIEYRGQAAPLARLLFVNILLNFPTLGFYRFWGKTRLRDFIWRHLRFRDEGFEYSGTGKELFIGFLIALLVLVPLVLLFNGLNAWLITVSSVWQGALGMLQTVLFLFLFQFAIYRARRYRMSRTQWRGIRAGQDGAATRYALLVMGYLLLTIVTLGLAYPWMQSAMERYQISNTHFGSRAFTFSGVGEGLFKKWLLAWILIPFTLGLSLLWYSAVSIRYFTNHTHYEGLSFESNLRARSIAWLYLKYAAVVFGTLGLIGVVISAVLPISDLANFKALPESLESLPIGGILTAILSVIAIYIAFNILATLFLTQGWIALFCRNLTISGEVDWDDIQQSALLAPTRGEGFADALDVGGL